MNILALGTAACRLANSLEKFDQYSIKYIDATNEGYKPFIKISAQKTHEEYEKNYKNIKLANIKGPVVFILSGAEPISGACLRILEQLRKVNLIEDITILYIKSDPSSLSKEARMQERITFGVLQEYTRSDMFEKMFVVDNVEIEKILDNNLSIQSYWEDINNVICSVYHMLNVFQNTEPLLTAESSLPVSAKIGTFGVVNYDSKKEKLFYDLKMARCKRYYFGINEQTLNENKGLLHDIRAFVASQADENTEVSFSIHSTEYEENYIYSIHYASLVQEQKEID
tara:strand:+ start:31 stop:882 length:852 start_codon:yes stop_codon:yes gene_type:complete